MVTSFPLNFSGFRTRSQKEILASESATDSDRKRMSNTRLRILIVIFIHCSKARAALFFGGPVEDDADFLKGDEAAFDHFVEAGKNFLDALGGFNDLEHDGQVLGQTENLVGVIDARPAVAGHAAQHGDAGEAGYGGSSVYHTDKILRLSQDLPIVLEVIESTERIEKILPRLDEMVEGGLITLEKVRVILYRAAKK